MTQTQTDQQTKTTGQQAGVRSEEAFDRVGRRIGMLAARASLQVRGTVSSIGKGIEQAQQSIKKNGEALDQSAAQRTEESHQNISSSGEQAVQPTTQQAEELVDRVGQRVALFSSIVGFQMRKIGARMREDAEDIWVEAQSIRHQRSSTKTPAQNH